MLASLWANNLAITENDLLNMDYIILEKTISKYNILMEKINKAVD